MTESILRPFEFDKSSGLSEVIQAIDFNCLRFVPSDSDAHWYPTVRSIYDLQLVDLRQSTGFKHEVTPKLLSSMLIRGQAAVERHRVVLPHDSQDTSIS